VVAFGVGIAAIVAPGWIDLALPAASVVFVGLVPLLLAYRVLVRRYRWPRYRARTGDPERAAVSTPPGRDVSETAAAFLTSEYVPTKRGLRAVAVALLAHYTGTTDADASTALDEYTWTNDPYAIAYFRGEGGPDLPRLQRVRDWLRPESEYRRNLRHATDAISAIAGVELPSEPTVTGQWFERLHAIGTPSVEANGGRVEENSGRVDTGNAAAPIGDEAPDERTPEATSPWETGHLRGVSVVALVAGGVGALFREPAIVLAGVIGVSLAAYAYASTPVEPLLAVDRRIDADRPEPGDVVTVTVTVTNRGERVLPDLRVVDGVPAALPVVDGSPRCGGVLRSGESLEFSYAVEARRGEHEFDPLLAIARDVAGSHETVERVRDETTMTCRPRFSSDRSLPLRQLTTLGHGTVPTAAGGEGVEFYSVREYRRGDPLRRIDWNRRARTGEFATLEFREERTTCVVCLIDARKSAYVTHRPDAPHAVDRAVAAAGTVATTLLERGNRVGVAALGPRECWLAPGVGRDHRLRLQELLVAHDAFGATPPAEESDGPQQDRRARQDGDAPQPVTDGTGQDGDVAQQITALRRRLPADAQIVLFSPLVDEGATSAARRLDASGHPVSVVSPDPTATRTASQRLARAVRRMRLGTLRRNQIRVVDWHGTERFPAAIARASRSWSR
jgi:uncharacterized repeat protein (TIGR01451 family)